MNYKRLWKYLDHKIRRCNSSNYNGFDKTPPFVPYKISKHLDKYFNYRLLLIRTRERKIRQPDKIHLLDSKGNIVRTFDAETNKRIYKLDEINGKLYTKDERKS